jgi:signal transduction histidine kinase
LKAKELSDKPRMGIRRRIFLYVSVGLIAMFGLLIFVGLRGLDQATDQVFEARLSTAKSMALILERDLIHVAADVQGFGGDLMPADRGPELDQLTEDMLVHLAASDTFAFFDSSGIVVLSASGVQLAAVGEPFPAKLPEPVQSDDDTYQILSANSDESGATGFAIVATRMGNGSEQRWVLVHLASRNSTRSFVPGDYLRSSSGTPITLDPEDATYHLEVIGSLGEVVLGIGGDETPGRRSIHYQMILDRSPLTEPVILQHRVTSGSDSESHVMGVVPLAESEFVLILEQPIDVALELPRRLRDQLLAWSTVGFGFALVIAWFTTRAVIKPTEQLTLAADRIGGGDLDTPIHVTARDEFGVLADRFESMRQQIANAYDAVEESNIVLESRVKERTAQLGKLLSRLISAQEDERRRLARELHDETAQTLGAVSIALARASDSTPADDGSSSAHLEHAREMVDSLIEDTRRLILDLRPMILDDLGLVPAIRWYADSRLGEVGIETAVQVDGVGVRPLPHVETALFRIVQEAVNNVVRHAEARKVGINILSTEGSVRIDLSDDGKGFDPSVVAGATDGHLGLLGMTERVAILGGEMSVRSQPGVGTTITVEMPLTGVGQ